MLRKLKEVVTRILELPCFERCLAILYLIELPWIVKVVITELLAMK